MYVKTSEIKREKNKKIKKNICVNFQWERELMFRGYCYRLGLWNQLKKYFNLIL